MYPWRCERCATQGIHHHSLADDPDALVGDDGRAYIEGATIVSTARGELVDARFYDCPEADLWSIGGDLLQLWRVGDGELHRALPLLDGTPTAALVDAWDHLAREIGALRSTIEQRQKR